MPFTPFHLGPALFVGLVCISLFDLPTLIVSSVIVDLEPFVVELFQLNYPLHGFIHSYLGGTIAALLVVVIMYALRGYAERIMRTFRLYQKTSFRKILATSFFGVYFHIFLDSFLYREMEPFYPLRANPFPETASLYTLYMIIYGFCVISFLLGGILYTYRTKKPTSRR